MEFKDMEVWKMSKSLSIEIIKIIKGINDKSLFALSNQITRSAISVPSNIAEGCGRQYKKETIQFLYIARGSLYELETQCIFLVELKEIDLKMFNDLKDKIGSCKRLLNGTIRYLKSSTVLK